MYRKAFFLFLAFVIIIFNSCNKNSGNKLVMENLFSISLGKFADEIDYFQRENLQFSLDNDLAMDDGFFYISNGRSGKVMQFNNYGNILSLIYNPELNPYPAEMFSRESENNSVNRKVSKWPFNSLGSIAVSGEDIYIVDKVATNRKVIEDGILRNQNILHFKNGELKKFIGLEGVGGSPFPYIENIWVNSLSELIVLYRTRDLWFVKWFTIDGDLRYTVPINKSFIPMPADETDLIPTLEGIIPDLNEYKLYIEMSYYKENKDEDIGEVFSGIYSLNVLPEAKYYGWARLPDNKVTIEDIEINTPYMLIGNIDEYLLYISYCREGMYKLLISNNSGEFIQEKILNINAHNIIYWNFYLSNEGILSGMFFTEEDVKIIWWRTDKLINGRKSE